MRGVPLFPLVAQDAAQGLLRYKCPEIRTTLVLPGYMQTPMFSTVMHPTSRLYQFLFPALQPLEVVKKIITSLDDQRSETIHLPFYATLSPLSPLAPSFIRDLVQWVSVSHLQAEPGIEIDRCWNRSWVPITRCRSSNQTVGKKRVSIPVRCRNVRVPCK